MEVSVIIPARNANATISRTLKAVTDQDLDRPYEVIVVDNGSVDATAAIAASAGASVSVISGPGGHPGAARNRGAAEAKGAVLAFTDADCFPEPGWLREGLRAMDGADLVQGVVRPDPSAARGPFDRTVSASGRGGLYETANLFVSRSAFESAGGFEDVVGADVEAPFGEDVWFGWKLRRGGGRIAFAPTAVVNHAVFPRGPAGYVRESRRRGLFCALAARIPELRDELFFGRWFLSSRTAAFDVAIAGLACALRSRSPLPAAAALPYAVTIARSARPWGRRAPLVAITEIAADAVGLASLASGSLRWRSPVL